MYFIRNFSKADVKHSIYVCYHKCFPNTLCCFILCHFAKTHRKDKNITPSITGEAIFNSLNLMP